MTTYINSFFTGNASLFQRIKRGSKTIRTLVLFILLSASAYAQAPQKMSYQAVIRDAKGQLVTEQPVGIRISILQGSNTGTAMYAETHRPTTNAQGLVTLQIGGGNHKTGSWSSIRWGAHHYFIQTQVDPQGGTDYQINGTSQLLSVPYALYAQESASGAKGAPGLSAFEVWKAADPSRASSTVSDFLAALKGAPGNGAGLSITLATTKATDGYTTDGSISATVRGGTTPYTYLWTNAQGVPLRQTAKTVNQIRGGIYDLYVTDAAGRSAFKRIQVAHGSPVVHIDRITPACAGDGGYSYTSSGGGVAVTVTGGTPPYQYEWSKWNSSARVSMQEIFTTTQNLEHAKAGHYSLLVTDASGRKGIGSNGLMVALDVPLYHPSVKITRTPACSADGKLLVEMPSGVSGGPFTYQWSSPDIRVVPGKKPLSTPPTFVGARATGLKVGRYSLVVTNAAGCKSVRKYIDLPSSFGVTPKVSVACNGDIDVTIPGYTGATPTYEFSRSSDFSTIIQKGTLKQNTAYYVRAVHAAGCKSRGAPFLYSPTLPGLRVTESQSRKAPACSGQSNGAIDIDVSYTGNQADLSYQWSKFSDFSTTFSTTQDLTNANSGPYYLKVSNKAGQCQAFIHYHVPEFQVIPDAVITHPSTSVAQDGAVYVSPRGQATGLTYAWSKDRSFSSVISTTKNLTGVGAGTYYLRITQTDGNRCSSDRPFTLNARN